jgi:hypothetical protein
VAFRGVADFRLPHVLTRSDRAVSISLQRNSLVLFAPHSPLLKLPTCA